MENNGERTELQRSLNMRDILALAFGTVIGWGWIMLSGGWVGSAGWLGALLAFAAGGVMCLFVGMAYAELTPALPLSGGELVFSYRAFGYNASWFTGWFITLAYLGVACWEGPALSNALGFLFGSLLPDWGDLYSVQGSEVTGMFLALGAAGAIVLTILNFRGAKASAIFQTIATLAMAIGGVAFFIDGCIMGSIKYMVPSFTDGTGFVTVLLAVPALYVGFDVIPQAAEEMNIPLNRVGRVLIITVCMAAVWYMLMIMGVAMSAPHEVTMGYVNDPDSVPVADLFSYATGTPVAGKLMICAAMCGILTSWNGFIVGATRVLFSMGRAKMLPAFFGRVHKKYGSPVAAVILVGILTTLSPLLGKSALGWFVDAAAFGTVVAYFMVSISFVALRIKEPELKRPFKAGGGIVTGIIAAAVSLFFATLYLPIYSPAPFNGIEWCMVGGWTLLGVIFFIANKLSKNGKTSKEETEYLLFGNDYKRNFEKEKAKAFAEAHEDDAAKEAAKTEDK